MNTTTNEPVTYGQLIDQILRNLNMNQRELSDLIKVVPHSMSYSKMKDVEGTKGTKTTKRPS
jgi:hypothetical protein